MFTMRYPSRVISGPGSLDALPDRLAGSCSGVLVVSGSASLRRHGVLSRIESSLRRAGVDISSFDRVEREPSVDTVDRCIEQLAEFRKATRGPVAVLGVGGGSALDVAKAAAGLANEPSTATEVFRGQPITTVGVQFVAVPTTAGSGAEATTNAVLTDTELGIKASIRSDTFLAELVVLDPELTLTLPPDVTAASGMDSLTQAIEGYTSIHANEFTRPLSREAVRLIGGNLIRAYSDGDNIAARGTAEGEFPGSSRFRELSPWCSPRHRPPGGSSVRRSAWSGMRYLATTCHEVQPACLHRRLRTALKRARCHCEAGLYQGHGGQPHRSGRGTQRQDGYPAQPQGH